MQAGFDPRVNLIYGDNAQGKTNLLEAIAYLSSAKSHRTRFDRELIDDGGGLRLSEGGDPGPGTGLHPGGRPVPGPGAAAAL